MNIVALFCGLVAVTFAAGIDTTDPTNQFKASFSVIDANHNGQLSLTEFFKIFDQYDTNGDGHLDLKEYLASTTVPQDLATPNFNYYDINKDGDISRAEVRTIFSNYDENGNGGITLGEFVHHFSEIQKAMNSAGVGK